MAKDVLITPADGKIEFKDINSNIDGIIQLDASDNLSISSPNGVLNIGNSSSNVIIGDGTTSVDVIFEQDGSIRGLSGKTITLGQSDSFIDFASRETTFKGGTSEINLRTLDDGTLSFEGTAGQLFSVSDGLTGTIFSVNDISGIPSIEVLDDGTVKLAEYGGIVTAPTADPGTNTTQIATTAFTIATTSGQGLLITESTGSRTLSSSDAGMVILLSNNTSNTITLPSATFAEGTRIDFIQTGTGTTTFTTSGITLSSKDNKTSLTGQYSASTVIYTSSSTAVLIGDLA